MSPFRIVFGYSWYPSTAFRDSKEMTLAYFERLRAEGFDIEAFCLTINPPGPRLTFRELDKLWRSGDQKLLQMYEDLERVLEGKDVLINGFGINLHPRFVERLPVFTVFQCFDDPESSEDLSKPVAAAYDLCLVGNIAELDTYRAWGAKHVEWTPMGLQPTIYDPGLTYEDVLHGERDIDIFMMADRTSPWRTERLDRLASAFPEGHFYGTGWPRGYLQKGKEIEIMKRARIGPNLHNSTGPINFRTFYLPANGVMQVCDNKSHLGKIYELDKEVVGFNTVEECIDLCRYYLAHDEERRQIAANGWRRAVTDYNEVSVFRRNTKIIQDSMLQKSPRVRKTGISIRQGRRARMRNALRAIASRIKAWIPLRTRGASGSQLARNIGEDLLEWPERSSMALEMFHEFVGESPESMAIADYGCGKQTLRRMIPENWAYTPFDFRKRSEDTIVCDFNQTLPHGKFDLIFCLGILEYLDRPLALLQHAIQQSRYVLFSYCGFTTMERRKLQGWKNNLSFTEIEECLSGAKAEILGKQHSRDNQWLYLVKTQCRNQE